MSEMAPEIDGIPNITGSEDRVEVAYLKGAMTPD